MLPRRAEGFILSSSAFKMQHGADRLVVPRLPELGKITDEEKTQYFEEEGVDVFAPVHTDSLLNMKFASDDEEDADDYEASDGYDEW